MGTRWRYFIIAALLITFLFGTRISVAKGATTPIDMAEAVSIAHAAVDGTKLDDDLEPMESALEPDFYEIQVFTTHPGTDGTIGYLAVNMWTGDVWDVSYCQGHSNRHLASEKARKLQEAIRRRQGLSTSAYQRLADKRPLCLFP